MEDHAPQRSSGFWDQAAFDARVEWGEEGVRRLAQGAEVVVIVDVLSFSTCVDVAVGRGAAVLPYRWRDARAEAFAREQRAHLAVDRQLVTSERPFSLSPATLLGVAPGDRLVLPSPNGATLSAIAAESGATMLAGCLRNVRAVALKARQLGSTVAIIAAGERWPGDGAALRPAVEDLVGAGAVLAAWGPERPSPEAVVAMAVYRAVERELLPFPQQCGSGRELIEAGYPDDVRLAADADVSGAAPLLHAGAYIASPCR